MTFLESGLGPDILKRVKKGVIIGCVIWILGLPVLVATMIGGNSSKLVLQTLLKMYSSFGSDSNMLFNHLSTPKDVFHEAWMYGRFKKRLDFYQEENAREIEKYRSIRKAASARSAVLFPRESAINEAILLYKDNLYFFLEEKFKDARSEIKIFMYLFEPGTTDYHPVNALVDIIRNAIRRGVSVQIFLDDSAKNHEVAAFLKRKGLPFKFLAGPSAHLKVIFIDNEWTVIGSANLSMSGLQQSDETSVAVRSLWFVNELKRRLLMNFHLPITY